MSAQVDNLITKVSTQGVDRVLRDQRAMGAGWQSLSKSIAAAGRSEAGRAATGAAATTAGIGMLSYLRGTIGAAAEAERVQAQFNTSLKTNLGLTGAAADGLSRYAESLAAMAGKSPYGDEEIKNAMAILATFRDEAGNPMSAEALKAYLPAIIDMSLGLRKAGKDESTLADAALMVGKAHQGQITALRRSGVMIDENSYRMNHQKAILEELRKEFGGQSAAAMKTADGSAAALNDTLGELSETIGKDLAPALRDLHAILGPVARDLKWLDEKTHGAGGKVLGIGAIAAVIAGQALVAGAMLKYVGLWGGFGTGAAGGAGGGAAGGAARGVGMFGKMAAAMRNAFFRAMSSPAAYKVADFAWTNLAKVKPLGGAALKLGLAATIAEALDWSLGTVTGQKGKRLGNGGWLPNLSPTRAISEGVGAASDWSGVHKRQAAQDRGTKIMEDYIKGGTHSIRKKMEADAQIRASAAQAQDHPLIPYMREMLQLTKDQTRVIVGGGKRTSKAYNQGDLQRVMLRTISNGLAVG
jgi:hypothetical protein